MSFDIAEASSVRHSGGLKDSSTRNYDSSDSVSHASGHAGYSPEPDP